MERRFFASQGSSKERSFVGQGVTEVKSEYNSLKKRVLKVLAEQESWISVPAIANKVNLPYPERGLYPYLSRLAKFGLVEAGEGRGRRVYYRITARGRSRLEFLAKNSNGNG